MNMKMSVIAVLAALVTPVSAQKLPSAPENNGLVPKTDTIYVNSQAVDATIINNGSTESLGVAIAANGNVIVGWEDDGEDDTSLNYLGAVWTLYDSAGNPVLADTAVNSIVNSAAGSISNKFLSYFRANKSAVYGGTSWGPKLQANLFSDGIGMGATSYYLGEEVVEFAPWDDANSGDFPSVQLLNNDGTPVKIVAGVSSAYATQNTSSIRIGDWSYLSNGNVVIVGESRQSSDLSTIYGGTADATHAIFRIVDQNGAVVKAETLVSETPEKSEIWHGVGAIKDGFAVRFGGPSGATIRMFDNAGNPKTTNIIISAATGYAIAGGGGRGDGAGFHGNGVDAYVHVSTGTDSTDGLLKVWVTVFNANGTVRYSKSASDDLEFVSLGRADAAIDAKGEVIVIFNGKFDASYQDAVMGRRLDATGKPVGGSFYVSEKEAPELMPAAAVNPRVAWRNGQVAVVWQSKNDLLTLDASGMPTTVVAMRMFSTFTVGSLEAAGLKRIVADTPVIVAPADALGNWEPYISVLGNSHFLIEGNTFADDGLNANQRYVVAVQPVAGGAMKLCEGFYGDNGQPFKGQINLSRQNGNPGRVAGDTRPGAVNYMVGGETSVHAVSEFNTGNRWAGFDRLADGRYGTVQIYKLDLTSMVPTPLSKALDSATGRLTTGGAAGNQISRYGGDIVGLDNGNFASVVEDRSRAIATDADAAVATIFAPDGSVVKDSFIVSKSDLWSNVAPFKGGFAVRAKPQDGSATRMIYFFDNTGKLLGQVDQATSGASFDTGRGDGTRLFGHINSPYVFLAGRAANTTVVKVAAFDSVEKKFAAIADVNEGAFTGNFDRANGASDALNRLVVSWVSQPSGYANQQVAARVLSFDAATKKFTPITSSFFPFVNVATNTIRTLQMSVAMTTKQICIAAKGEINLQNKPDLGADSKKEINFYTVFSHPAPKDDPTMPVGGFTTAPTLKYSVAAGKITISWEGTGYTLESKQKLTDASWTVIGTQNSVTESIGTTSKFYRLRK